MSSLAGLTATGQLQSATTRLPASRDRIHGMLLGTLIGDAAGGPVEFKSAEQLKQWLPDLRGWSSERFSKALTSGSLAEGFGLLPYRGIRPDTAAYGPWTADAPAGTVTDDSRHKMIVLNMLRAYAQDAARPLRPRDLCQAYVDFCHTAPIKERTEYAQLCAESLREYNLAARWVLGNRDPAQALPVHRLWAGTPTCAGQMALLPLAAIYPGQPEVAYRAAYTMGVLDSGEAKDINSALVAGLAEALGAQQPSASPARWKSMLRAMRDTDPYRYASIPFVARPAVHWLEFARDASQRANGSPAALFKILENEGRPRYFWDAHFTYASAFACLMFCDYRVLEALQVSLVFGHDTDSAAQVIGALGGAVQGPEVFPPEVRRQVSARFWNDYGQDLDEWVELLSALGDRTKFPKPVQLDDA